MSFLPAVNHSQEVIDLRPRPWEQISQWSIVLIWPSIKSSLSDCLIGQLTKVISQLAKVISLLLISTLFN